MNTETSEITTVPTQAVRIASVLLQQAAALNMIPALDGEPCRATFRAARAVLAETFGEDVAEAVVDAAISVDEYDAESLTRRIEERSHLCRGVLTAAGGGAYCKDCGETLE